MELLLRAAFDHLFGSSSAPSVPLFERFQSAWFAPGGLQDIGFQEAMIDTTIRDFLGDDKDRIVDFIKQQITEVQPRDDYLELLQLALVFFEDNEEKFKFKAPGAISHARWMAKGLYCLKIWLFRHNFKLSKREKRILPIMCKFIIQVNLEAWFQCGLPLSAPRLDLALLKKLLHLSNSSGLPKSVNVYEAAAMKLCNHLWYLSDEQVALAFFDPEVPLEEKRRMTEAIVKRKGSPTRVTSLTVPNPALLLECCLADFVSTNTREFFNITGFSDDFLQEDPVAWEVNEEYQKARGYLKKMRVVNDVAERGVALIKKYNKCLTKDEEQLQFLLQVVQEHRAMFPDTRKSTILQSLPESV